MILNANHWIFDISISLFNLREMMLNEQNIQQRRSYIHTQTIGFKNTHNDNGYKDKWGKWEWTK